MARLEQFGCNTCGRSLGWTAPGESRRMNTRAHLFCDECKDAPTALTGRQQDLLTVLTELRDAGQSVTLAAAAEVMGVSRSRAQQIKDALRARGGTTIDVLLEGEERKPFPVPFEVLAALAASAPVPAVATLAATFPIDISGVAVTPDDWSYAEPEYAQSVSGTADSVGDPAAFGGEFV